MNHWGIVIGAVLATGTLLIFRWIVDRVNACKTLLTTVDKLDWQMDNRTHDIWVCKIEIGKIKAELEEMRKSHD